jgi:hypothetical protein
MIIDIPAVTPLGKPVETIGIWMSGGADSSLLCYLLAEKIKKENLFIKIQPLTVQKRPGIYESIPVRNKIAELLDAEDIFKNHIIYAAPDSGWVSSVYLGMFANKNKENIKQNLFQVLLSGITTNPPREVQKDFHWGILEDVEQARGDSVLKEKIRYFTQVDEGIEYEFLELKPFFEINKKEIARLYKEKGLLESLFPLTRSCEDKQFFEGHCGKCWWCEERMWAFGKLE